MIAGATGFVVSVGFLYDGLRTMGRLRNLPSK
jgi:hypothetical protein